MQEREKQFLLQHLEGAKQRRQQGGGEVVVPLINLLIKYALEQKEGADEPALIKRLTQEGRFKSYPNTLFHAYRKVLRLIHQSHEEDPANEVSHLLYVAAWMRRRRQLDQMGDILDQAEEVARKYEFFHEELQVQEHRKFLHAIQPKRVKLDAIHSRIRELRAMATQVDELVLLADEVQLLKLLISENGSLPDRSNPFLVSIRDCKSVRAKVHYLRIWTNLHLNAGKNAKALECIQDLVSLLEGNAHMLQDPILSHWYHLYVFSGLQTSIALGRKEQIAHFTQLLESGSLKTEDPAKYFEYTTRVWLWSSDVQHTTTDVGAQRIAQIQRSLDKYAPVLGEGADHMISHQVAVVLMLAGQPRKAVPWINRYMRNQPGLQRPHLVAFSYVFFVIAKFELAEWDMVERGKRSALTFLQKHKLSNPVYEALLKGLVRCTRKTDEDDFRAAILQLRTELASLVQDVENAKANRHFDLIAWLDRMASK